MREPSRLPPQLVARRTRGCDAHTSLHCADHRQPDPSANERCPTSSARICSEPNAAPFPEVPAGVPLEDHGHFPVGIDADISGPNISFAHPDLAGLPLTLFSFGTWDRLLDGRVLLMHQSSISAGHPTPLGVYSGEVEGFIHFRRWQQKRPRSTRTSSWATPSPSGHRSSPGVPIGSDSATVDADVSWTLCQVSQQHAVGICVRSNQRLVALADCATNQHAWHLNLRVRGGQVGQ